MINVVEKTELEFKTVEAEMRTGESTTENELPPAKFLKKLALFTFFFLLVLIGINVRLDIYGLFRPAADRNLPVYYNERLSKFLLAYHYVPEKFNTVLIGTSLSANLDVRTKSNIDKRLSIYNASMMGANVSEIKPMVDKLIDGNIRNVILCFSPYMIKNSGVKEVEFDDKLYYGAFGSKNLYETYLVGLIRHFELMPKKFPRNQIDAYGVNHFTDMYKVKDIEKHINWIIQVEKTFDFDSTAVKELGELIATLKNNNINFVGYFHPIPKEVHESKQASYARFEKLVRAFVADDTKLVDYNAEKFSFITTDHTNYIDQGHLSKKGQALLVPLLIEQFNTRYEYQTRK
jgi:hypothetical protein